MTDKSWQDALTQAGLAGPSRREKIAELRTLTRTARRRHMGVKMLAAAVIGNLVMAWTLMTSIGIAHAGWWHAIPTIGFGTASLLTGLLALGVVITVLTVQTARELT